jgi:methyl-accepting chemotaxis protein
MAGREHRSSSVRGGLTRVFTMWTWLSIAPAVGVGLTLTAVFAYYYLDLDIVDMLWVMLFGLVAMVVMGVPGTIIWASAFRNRVLRPLRDIGGAMVRAGEGDLTARTDVDSDDEIGVLASETDHLIASLESIASQVRGSAESVSASATQLSASAQEINSSTMEISSSVQQIAHGAELQSRKVEETSASMEVIASGITDTARQSGEASRSSEEAARLALEGEHATEEAIEKIAEIQRAIETLAGSVATLGLRSAQIGHIVNVITSIAEQTNLLSLNAAIEAARAGEAGRGFSVVADEVRKLADGSAQAAEQIRELIEEVQEETGKAVRHMEASTIEMSSGAKVVTKSGEKLRGITESVSRAAMLAEQIAHATAEQTQQVSSMDKSMHDIAAVAEQNAASVEQTAAAAEEQTACMQEVSAAAQELADMSGKLEESVRLFRTE